MTQHSNSVRNMVVKFGTTALSTNGKLDQAIFNNSARQIVGAQKLGAKITIVSSGGILAGRERMRELKLETGSMGKGFIAGVGARHLLDYWGQAFETYGGEVGQIYISYANLECERELSSIKTAVRDYHQYGIIPVFNENDVVSPTEVKMMEACISENDNLAEMVALHIHADSILFLTSCGFIFEHNPDTHPDSRRCMEIDIETAKEMVASSALEGVSKNGTGGMAPKLEAAIRCYQRRMKACIASVADDGILKFAMEEKVGTLIGGKEPTYWP